MSSWKNNNWKNNVPTDDHQDRTLKGTTIIVKNNDVNRAMKKLKKRLQDEGWFNEMRKREYYVSKAENRRKKLAVAQVREKKRQQDILAQS